MGITHLMAGLFGLHGPEQAAARSDARRRTEEWKSALPGGTHPAAVGERLSGARAGRVPWVATMTAGELGLSRSHGFRPVAMVSGTCWWHYGFSWTRGHAEGWRAAVGRMKAEAVLAGANAILDVQMRKTALPSGSSMDFTVIGTAVSVDGLPPSPDPILSTLPAFEFVRLLECGIVPVGIAVGAHYEWASNPDNVTESFMRWGKNMPLARTSEFWERVRNEAIRDLRRDARRSGNGILAHTHFGQLLERGPENNRQLLGRHIIVATVVDTSGAGAAPDVRCVLDLAGGGSTLDSGGVAAGSAYDELNEESGEI